MVIGTALSARVHATLVVGVTTQNGWVVCADKRVYDRARGDVDEVTKVTRVPGNAVVAFVGGHRFYRLRREGNGSLTLLPDIFNADDIVQSFTKTRRFTNTDVFWSGLATQVVTKLTEVFARESNLQRDSTENFKAVFYWSGSNGRQRRRVLNVSFVGKTDVSWTLEDTQIHRSDISDVALEGSLADELQKGHDPRFDAVRNDSRIKKFLEGRPATKSTSTREAETFAKHLIQLSSQRLADLKIAEGHIGPTSDCASVE
jgi:hypothetical protein